MPEDDSKHGGFPNPFPEQSLRWEREINYLKRRFELCDD